MLHWNEADVMSFFGVELSYDDDCHSFSAEVSRDGLRLLMTIFDLEGAVYVSIFRDGIPEALFTVCRELCTHAQITNAPNHGRQCFEAGFPRHPVSNMGIPPILAHGFRVYVQPHFQVELIEPRYYGLEHGEDFR